MAALAVCSECGWSKKYKSPGWAANASAKHKCSREFWRRDMAARKAAREAAVGPTRECQHPIANHTHGTHAAYVLDKCRCRPCKVANRAYENQRMKDRAYGRERLVDANPVRAHLQSLMNQGMGLKQIAVQSGVAHGGLSKLWFGHQGRPPSRRVRPATAERLLAVTYDPDTLLGGSKMAATGTMRRLQALVYNGWSITQLGVMLGDSDLHTAFGRRYVTARRYREVKELYARLWNVKPPRQTKQQKCSATKAHNFALARGWKPGAWWNDIDSDPDPGYSDVPLDEPLDDDPVIDEIAIERRIGGDTEVRLTREEKVVAAHLMIAKGYTETQISDVLNTNGVEVKKMLATQPVLDLAS